MASIQEILGRDINSLKELREEIKRLQDSIAGVDPETEQFKTTVEQLTAAQEQLRSVTGKNAQENNAAKDSIVGMEQEYKNLYNTYKMLTEEQRNSGMGKNMAQDLAVLSDKINNAKKEVGNFKNNIGNYTGSIIDAFKKMGISVGGLSGPLKTATTGMGSLNQVMKANPIGLVVSAIMGLISLIKSLSGSIKNNEELQMRWNQAMSAFQPIIDGVKNALDGMAQVIVSIVEAAAQGFQKIQELGARIQDFFGKDKEHTKRLKEKQAVYNGLAKSENELTKNKREYMKLNAADTAEVERLREEISLTTDKAEKEELVNQAKEIQAQIDARNIELAKEELRIAVERAKLSPNSAADNQRIAELTAAVENAEAAAARAQRTLNKAFGKGSGGGAAAMDEAKNSAKELYEQLIKDSKDRITQLREEYEEQKKLLEKYGYDTTLLTKKYNREVRVIIKEEAERQNQERMEQIQKQINFDKALFDAELNVEKDKYKRMEILQRKAYDNQASYTLKANKLYAEARKYATDTTKTQVEEYIKAYDILKKEIGPEQIQAINKQFKLEIPTGSTKEEVMEWVNNLREESMDKLVKLAKEMNDQFGTNIQIPPEIDKDNIDDFAKLLERIRQMLIETYKTAQGDYVIEGIRRTVNAAKTEFYRLGKGIEGVSLEEVWQNRITEWIERGSFEHIEEYIASMEWGILDTEKEVLKQSLENYDITEEKKVEIRKRLYEVELEMYDRQMALAAMESERLQELWASAFDGFDKFASSIQTVTNAMSSLIQQEISEGKISEAQAKKKRKQLETLEKVSLAANIFQIAGSTANGIMGIWNAYALEKVANAQTAAATGPAAAATLAALNAKSLASAIINTAAMATAGAANIAAATMGTISKLQQFKEEGSAAVASTPNMAMIDSSVYSYRETEQNTPESDELNRPIWVSVVDIESALNRVKVVESESRW